MAIFVAPVTIASAQAQMQCTDHKKVVTRLTEKYQETKQGWGIGANEFLYEVFSSPSGSWTFIVTSPGGPTCVIMSGQNWDGGKHPELAKSASKLSPPM